MSAVFVVVFMFFKLNLSPIICTILFIFGTLYFGNLVLLCLFEIKVALSIVYVVLGPDLEKKHKKI